MLITGANIDKRRGEKLALPFFLSFFGVVVALDGSRKKRIF